MQLKDATDLERRVYEQCLAVEEMPASPEQTALVSTLSEAGHQLQTLRAENAELKRQAEALREDAEIDLEKFSQSFDKLAFGYNYRINQHELFKDGEIVAEGGTKHACLLNYLREAAKGEVE